MPAKAHFGDPMIEQRHLAAGVAVVELDSGVIRIDGDDRLEWLHSMLTADFKNLKPGQSREALLLDVQGHVEHVFHASDDGTATTLIVSGDAVAGLLVWFDRMTFRSKVSIQDVSSECVVVGAVAEIEGLTAAWTDPWPDVVAGGVRYAKASGAKWGYREYLVPRKDYESFSGKHELAGTDALDALRIAAWRPSLAEVDGRTMPHEVDWMATAVHMSKGCYRGQEAVAKTHNLGHPPRRLVFLHLDGSGHALPEVGSEIWVLNADGTRSERARGIVTSMAQHFEQGPIALGLVQRTVPEDAALLVVSEYGAISAAQEVIVPSDAGKAAGISRPSLLMGGKR
ncbi:MAG: folate-binding protein [Microbacteriaceae bacterium]|nr:folate-binding protein [Microbacteriaceae bacterium]